jgi:hypothetical protein
MIIDEQTIIATTLAIRPHLNELLRSDKGEQTRQQIDQLLQRFQAGEDVENDIWDVLTDDPILRRWTTKAQQANNSQKSGGSGLPGSMTKVSVPWFKCPHCDESWPRDRVGRPVPLCKVHNVPLDPV